MFVTPANGCKLATLFKKDSSNGVSLCNSGNFLRTLFYRTPPDDFFSNTAQKMKFSIKDFFKCFGKP